MEYPGTMEAEARSLSVARRGPVRLVHLMERLSGVGLRASIAAVDGSPPEEGGLPALEWHQVRLDTMAGPVILAAEGGRVAVLIPADADRALRLAQTVIADQLRTLPDAL
jgi:hypothetical protein